MERRERLLLQFDIARENRRFEIQMFWQRANYFLVLNTALAIGVFTVDNVSASVLISGFGVVASVLWYRTNLGAKFWQSFWENEVHRLAKLLGIYALALDDDAIYAAADEIEAQDERTNVKKWINKQIRKHPSVSANMILLSMWTILGWSLLLVAFTIIGIVGMINDDPYFIFD